MGHVEISICREDDFHTQHFISVKIQVRLDFYGLDFNVFELCSNDLLDQNSKVVSHIFNVIHLASDT